MKPHPRIRKTIKWGGAAATVALIGLYAVSVFFSLDWQGERWRSLNVCQGMIHANTFARAPRVNSGWLITPLGGRDRRIVCSFEFTARPRGMYLFVPLFVPLAVVVLPTAIAWRLDRKARRIPPSLCGGCRYDRTGLAAAAVCPECGVAPTVRST